MSSENPLNRSSCSLGKPSQMPGRHCEAFVIASQVLPVQLRNSCMCNALRLLGCHESWRTEGTLWNHIFSWLICWEGKHSDKNNGPSRFSHSSVQSDLRNLWVLPAVILALIKPNILPLEASVLVMTLALQAPFPLPYIAVPLKLTRSFSALQLYPAMSFAKWKVKSFLQNLMYQQVMPL